MELLRELEGSVGGVRPVALPALEALRCVVARAVTVVVHHVEHVPLRPLLWHRLLVVRAVHVQVVVYAHVDVVVPAMEPGVSPVPEDRVPVGYHFGAGLLAENTHPEQQTGEQHHLHLYSQHHYPRV